MEFTAVTNPLHTPYEGNAEGKPEGKPEGNAEVKSEGNIQPEIQSLIDKKNKGIQLTQDEKNNFNKYYNEKRMNELKNKIESNMIQYPEALEYEYLLEKQNNKTTDKYEVWKTKITNEKEEEIRKKYNLQKQTTSLLTPAKTTDITTSGISGNNNKTSFDQLVKRATGGKKSTRRPRKNRRITKRKHIRRKK
jgi:hypothetical protein